MFLTHKVSGKVVFLQLHTSFILHTLTSHNRQHKDISEQHSKLLRFLFPIPLLADYMLTCLLASLTTKTNLQTIFVPDTDMNTKWEKVCKFQKQKKNQTMDRQQKLANKSIKCGDKASHTVKLSEEEITSNW